MKEKNDKILEFNWTMFARSMLKSKSQWCCFETTPKKPTCSCEQVQWVGANQTVQFVRNHWLESIEALHAHAVPRTHSIEQRSNFCTCNWKHSNKEQQWYSIETSLVRFDSIQLHLQLINQTNCWLFVSLSSFVFPLLFTSLFIIYVIYMVLMDIGYWIWIHQCGTYTNAWDQWMNSFHAQSQYKSRQLNENRITNSASAWNPNRTGADESAHLHRINTSTTFINTRRKTNIWRQNGNTPYAHAECRLHECDL